MKKKIVLCVALWAVVGFAVTGVYRMFGSPVDYAAFVFWVTVIAVAFGPAVIVSYELAKFVVNDNDSDPEEWDFEAQIAEQKALGCETGCVFYDDSSCFIYWRDASGAYWCELLDTTVDFPYAVLDRSHFVHLGSVFSWMQLTAFSMLDDEEIWDGTDLDRIQNLRHLHNV